MLTGSVVGQLAPVTTCRSLWPADAVYRPCSAQVKVIEGVFTESQKREMVRKLTDAMVSIEGENMRAVTWVIVEEVDSGNWGIGGKPLTTADVKALAAGKPTG